MMGDTTIDTTQQQIYDNQQANSNANEVPAADESTTQASTEDINGNDEAQKELSEAEKKQNSSLFLEGKRSQGYQLTHINNGETNFFQYGSALSPEVQNMIKNSFDCQQDYELQAQIAELFKQGNVWQTNTLINELYKMGLTVDIQTVATQYITDWKNGRSSYLRTDGAINVLTISDGKGGEIVIADANGNGAIECEELFMNEILEGLASDIYTAGDIGEVIGGKSGGGAGGSSGGISGFMSSIFNTVKDGVNKLKLKSTQKIAQNTYNKLIDNYIKQYHCSSVNEAIAQVNKKYHCNVGDIQYSGKYKGMNYIWDSDASSNQEISKTLETQKEELEKLYQL